MGHHSPSAKANNGFVRCRGRLKWTENALASSGLREGAWALVFADAIGRAIFLILFDPDASAFRIHLLLIIYFISLFSNPSSRNILGGVVDIYCPVVWCPECSLGFENPSSAKLI